MYDGNKIGVVVLAYKVEKQVRSVIDGLPEFVDRIYVVDDGSPDSTAEVVRTSDQSRVHLLRFERNQGPGAALRRGYEAALQDDLDIVVKVDGDGQMNPLQVESLIQPIAEAKADYTKGDRLSVRANRSGMPTLRLVGNVILTWLTRLASGYWHLSDSQNGFTAISKEALKTIDLDLYAYYGYLNDLLVRLNVQNCRVVDVPMLARYGDEKSSIRLIWYMPKVSLLLLRSFLWRLKKKYLEPMWR